MESVDARMPPCRCSRALEGSLFPKDGLGIVSQKASDAGGSHAHGSSRSGTRPERPTEDPGGWRPRCPGASARERRGPSLSGRGKGRAHQWIGKGPSGAAGKDTQSAPAKERRGCLSCSNDGGKSPRPSPLASPGGRRPPNTDPPAALVGAAPHGTCHGAQGQAACPVASTKAGGHHKGGARA